MWINSNLVCHLGSLVGTLHYNLYQFILDCVLNELYRVMALFVCCSLSASVPLLKFGRSFFEGGGAYACSYDMSGSPNAKNTLTKAVAVLSFCLSSILPCTKTHYYRPSFVPNFPSFYRLQIPTQKYRPSFVERQLHLARTLNFYTQWSKAVIVLDWRKSRTLQGK